MGINLEQEEAVEGKMGKKSSKKKKSHADASEEVSVSTGAVPNGTYDVIKLSKPGEKEKGKKKVDNSNDVTPTEHMHVKDYAEANSSCEKVKEKKKKRKRATELVEENEKPNYEIHREGEGRLCLRADDGKDLRTDVEVKARKEKKKKHKGDRNDSLLSPMEFLEDKYIAETKNGEEQSENKNKAAAAEEFRKVREDNDVDASEEVERKMGSKENTKGKTNMGADMKNGEKFVNNKKGRKDQEAGDCKGRQTTAAAEEVGKVGENNVVDVRGGVEKKKRRRENRKDEVDLGTEMKNGEEQIENDKKGRKDEEVGNAKGKKKTTTAEEVGRVGESNDAVVSEVIVKKKRKRENEKGKVDLDAELKNGQNRFENNKKGRKDQEVGNSKGKKKKAAAEEIEKVGEENDVDVSQRFEKKKRKKDNKKGNFKEGDFGDSNVHSTGNEMQDVETKKDKEGKKKPKSVPTKSEEPKPKGKTKKVSFSGRVEVFPSSNCPSEGKELNQEDGLVRGKRFTPEEDEMVKEAVFKYIASNGLGEDGLNMVLQCKSYPKIKNCWKEIGAVLPHRPYKAIYYRAHILFERSEKRTWSPEELEVVRKYHEEHGPKWKELADDLGKHRVHLKDTWRRIKLPNKKNGHWSQEEYQSLFDLVNMDLRMRAFEQKKSKHGMLRDNVGWTAISGKLSTRSDAVCCLKWYQQLTSPMVAEGEWADTDDYRLLDKLFRLDACCMEDVDWDYLLEHRSGDLCRKRWKQMVHHLGLYGNKSFAEQVEVLSKRYCPDLVEAREVWDNKPVVP